MRAVATEAFPIVTSPPCGDIFCSLDHCLGPESHGAKKKPWYMTQKPVVDPKNIPAPPVPLMKMDGWVLEKSREDDPDSHLHQYCPSEQWKKLITVKEIRAGYCNSCCETIPQEIVAAYTMHNWALLQQYEADMNKYGHDPYEVETPAPIQVFR